LLGLMSAVGAIRAAPRMPIRSVEVMLREATPGNEGSSRTDMRRVGLQSRAGLPTHASTGHHVADAPGREGDL